MWREVKREGERDWGRGISQKVYRTDWPGRPSTQLIGSLVGGWVHQLHRLHV